MMKHSVSVLYHSVSIFDCKISVESLNQSHFPHNCTFTHHFKLKYPPFLNWKIQISYKLFYCFFPDWETKEYEFVNGEIFTVGWGRKDGVMHSNCTTSIHPSSPGVRILILIFTANAHNSFRMLHSSFNIHSQQ